MTLLSWDWCPPLLQVCFNGVSIIPWLLPHCAHPAGKHRVPKCIFYCSFRGLIPVLRPFLSCRARRVTFFSDLNKKRRKGWSRRAASHARSAGIPGQEWVVCHRHPVPFHSNGLNCRRSNCNIALLGKIAVLLFHNERQA